MSDCKVSDCRVSDCKMSDCKMSDCKMSDCREVVRMGRPWDFNTLAYSAPPPPKSRV